MITLHFDLQPQYKYELFHINFKENDHERLKYQQRSPIPVIENSLAKINWKIEFHKEKKKPENNANKVDI